MACYLSLFEMKNLDKSMEPLRMISLITALPTAGDIYIPCPLNPLANIELEIIG